MEEESFEDEEIARCLNEHFVAIKVDREERPDVDAIYMSAVQALTGGGGWPMTVWLTPDRKPFYGGTYFPPRDGVRGARPVLHQLPRLARRRTTRRASQRRRPRLVAELARDDARAEPAPRCPAPRRARRGAAAVYRGRFDAEHGGDARRARSSRAACRVRASAPRTSGAAGDADSLAHGDVTLERMAARRHPRPARRRLPSLLAPTRAGSCRTSRRCSTTTRCSPSPTSRRYQATRPRATSPRSRATSSSTSRAT